MKLAQKRYSINTERGDEPMIYLVVLVDLIILAGVLLFIYRISDSKKQKEKTTKRYNMELFRDPTIRQNTSMPESLGLYIPENKKIQMNKNNIDNNDMMRRKARRADDDIAIRSVTSFEQGGLSMNNNINDTTTNITSYMNM
ncbi:MAG: hypothetical protein PHN69_05430 [Candidatus Pacebacteria bacterium]|nr:hypothetical protein [Candidatus Paceibacterota bacterium]